MFEQFWKQYPRKVAKRLAEKSWLKLTDVERSNALDALPNHLKFWKVKETDSEFIPHASTWLNQGRWDDELEIEVKEKKKPALPWYIDEQLTMLKAQEVGVTPRAGEDWGMLRKRINHAINQREMG